MRKVELISHLAPDGAIVIHEEQLLTPNRTYSWTGLDVVLGLSKGCKKRP